MKTKNSFLICLIGLDGSGKTTLARRLVGEMQHRGFKTRYVMGRFSGFVLFRPLLWGVKTLLLSRKRTDQTAEGIRTKKELFQNRWLAAMWWSAVLFDYSLQLAWKVRLPLMINRNVCADRYIYDTVVDVAADSSLSISQMQKMLDRLLHFAPGPDLVFLLDLPGEVAYERNLPKRDNLSMEYYRMRRDLFLAFKNRPELIVLDGSLRPEELFNQISSRLKARQIFS